jgi:DNA mismatch repair protein MutS
MPTADQPESAQPPASSRSEGTAASRNGRVTDEPQTFRSLLFGGSEADLGLAQRQEPECFGDLNLDQMVASVVARKQGYELAPFFYTPLREVDAIRFRQEVFLDLERPEVLAVANAFGKQELVSHYGYQQKSMGRDEGRFGHYHRSRAFLNAALNYVETIEALATGLGAAGIRSRGMLGLRAYLEGYTQSEAFRALRDEGRELDDELDRVRYTFLINGSRITVGPYADEQPDYSAEVSDTFERFRQEAVRSYLPEFNDWDAFSGIGVLYLVSQLYPELFARLDRFCQEHTHYLDRTIAVLDRELQFYLGYLEYIQPLRNAGLSFSYPQLSAEAKAEQALDTFDLVLASQRVRDHAAVVCNDLTLDGSERIIVVTGPNNGGKTTMARTIGQLHYLARLGCPVAGCETRLFVCDEVFTRFERREDISTLEGKLQDELNRLRDALAAATPSSLFVLNEMFNSTTAQDALSLSREIFGQVSELDALCVCVTFLDELATFNEQTVSMVSSVDPADPAIRTYKVIRRPADGRAYARALAEKYGLTYQQLTGKGEAL